MGLLITYVRLHGYLLPVLREQRSTTPIDLQMEEGFVKLYYAHTSISFCIRAILFFSENSDRAKNVTCSQVLDLVSLQNRFNRQIVFSVIYNWSTA